MSKNIFNINDNYARNCDKIKPKQIGKHKVKTVNSPFMKAKIRQNKWLAKHGSGSSTTVITVVK